MAHAILIIEDETALARNVAVYLGNAGYEVQVAHSALEGLAALESFRPEVVLLDHNLPGMSGLEALGRIRAHDAGIRVVMATGHSSTELAVQAMKAGAADFLTKPLVLAELRLLLERLVQQDHLEHTVDYYHQREARDSGLDKIVGDSPAMHGLRRTLRTLLDNEARLDDGELPAVLVVGETGTGKELVARALHFDGPRSDRPFVEINCGALPAQLVEAELFGYERGAFTDAHQRKAGLLETAAGGSVFLDEIGEAELSTQVKLLKILEDRRVRRLGGLRDTPVTARVISATNRSLEELVAKGRFRADFYFRLRIVEIHVPPLRERGDDILLLARHFLELHAARYRKHGLRLSSEAEAALRRHAWPGNVRELRNSMEQAVLVADGRVITPAQLRLAKPMAPEIADPVLGDGDLNLERMERHFIVQALERSEHNVSAAARLLGISRDTLRYRLERLEWSDRIVTPGPPGRLPLLAKERMRR